MENRVSGCCPEKDTGLWITNLNFWLTSGCNFRCRYCYENKIKDLPIKTADKEIIKQLLNWFFDDRISGKNNNLSLNFFGGEPLLYPDLIEFTCIEGKKLEAKTGKRISFSMTTNASLLTKEMVEFFKIFNMGYLISLDGDLDTMLRWRGIQDSEKNLEILKRTEDNARLIYQLYPNLTTRITLPNSELKRIFHNTLYIYSLGCNNISAHIVTDGAGEIQSDGVEDYKQQMEEMYYWLKSFLIRGQKIPYSTVDKCLNHRGNPLEQGACGAGKGFLGISPDGGIYPCHRFVIWDEWRLGDVFHYELDNDKRKIFINFKRKNLERCLNCESKTCHSQCYASNYAKFKNIFSIHPLYCEIKKIEEKIADRLKNDPDIIKRQIKTQKNKINDLQNKNLEINQRFEELKRSLINGKANKE
ncbi:MAG TPA: SPASM domain-containing protein [Defluviitoga tunisiensis]|nr:SPASM domain-containing protein [bacterium]HPP10257.1 SPASM domain-containing protein [Defluviitoga tunisiensis]